MAIYTCDECGEMLDGDHSPCMEHPTEPEAFCCEECASILNDAYACHDSPEPRLNKSNAHWENNR
jgi:hypothetical protein